MILEDLYSQLTVDRAASGAELIILGGPPYSGKSTYAQELSRQGYVHIWVTVLKKRYGLGDEVALDICEALIAKLLRAGYPVVFDFLNHKKAIRDRFETIASELGVKYQVVWFDVTKEELYSRRKASNKSEGRSDISEEIIDKIFDEMELPDNH